MNAAKQKNFELTNELRAQIEEISSRYKSQPSQLMKILLEIQEISSNSFPREVAVVVSETSGIPVSKLYGFISFYSMFSAEPRGKYVVRMCESAPCHVCRAKDVMDAISKTLGINPGETTEDRMFTLEYCECLGICNQAPAIMINDRVYGDLTPGSATTLMENYMKGDID